MRADQKEILRNLDVSNDEVDDSKLDGNIYVDDLDPFSDAED